MQIQIIHKGTRQTLFVHVSGLGEWTHVLLQRTIHQEEALRDMASKNTLSKKANNTALAVCRIFARQVGFKWAGGLSMGGGETLSHGSLTKIGLYNLMIRNQKKALGIAADALSKGEPIPEKATVLMAKGIL